MTRAPAAWSGSLALLLAASCGPKLERQEARAVAEAVERLQKAEAPPAERLDLVAALEGLDATTEPAAGAKDACARAFRALGEQGKAAAVASAGLDPTSKIPADEVIRAAASAQQKAKLAEEEMPRCLAAKQKLLELLAR